MREEVRLQRRYRSLPRRVGPGRPIHVTTLCIVANLELVFYGECFTTTNPTKATCETCRNERVSTA